MQAEARRQITWIIIAAGIASLIVFATYRRHEMDNLRATIATGTPRERLAAVRHLVAKEKVAEALQDQPRWVQDRVVSCIAMMGTPEALFQLCSSIWLMDDPVAARAKAILTRFDLIAIGPLVKALKDKDPNVRSGATDPLVAIGEPVINSLLPLMDAWDQYVRDGVVTIFGEIGEPVTDELVRIIQRTEPSQDETAQRFLWKRDTAVRAMLAMKVPAIQPIIDHLIRFDHPDVRATAAQMLGQIADQTVASPIAEEDAARVVGPLLERLNSDPAWTVRRKAALALGPLKDVARQRGAVQALIAHLNDSRAEVKAASAEALGRLGDPAAAAPLVHTLLTNRLGAVREIVVALERIGPDALPAIVPALRHPEVEVRKAATEAIAVIGTPAAVVPLASMLQDSDVTIRRLASDALRTLADERVVPQLVAALADPDWHVYYGARDALANIGGPAVPGLIAALGSGNPRMAHMAEQALARIGTAAIPALAAALASPNAETRRWAAIALGDVGPASAAAVIRVLRDPTKPSWARAAAADALGRTGAPDAVEPLIKAASAPAPDIRIAALRALVRLGDETATETLVNALADRDNRVRQVAMRLLSDWRAANVADALKKCLRWSDVDARRRAAIVLAYQTAASANPLLAALGAEVFGTKQQLGPTLEPILAQAVADPNEPFDVRMHAVRALGYIGREKGVAALKSLLVPGNPLAGEAARAVARIGRRLTEERYRAGEEEAISLRREPSDAARMLIQLFEQAEDEQLRMYAAVGLSLMGDDPVWGLLQEFTKVDDEKRLWIAAILGAIGKPASDPTLDVRGTAKDPTLKEWATIALPVIGDAQAMDLIDHLPPEEKPDAERVQAAKAIKERILEARART